MASAPFSGGTPAPTDLRRSPNPASTRPDFSSRILHRLAATLSWEASSASRC